MITATEFCNKYNGTPWVNRGESVLGADCWGIVLASFREIEGVELPVISGYGDKECSTSDAVTAADLSKFSGSAPVDGAIMVVFDNKGGVSHVGRCLCGRVLHATEALGVVHGTYQSLNNKYSNIRYFKYD